MFLLFDGNRSVGEVLATTSGLGVTQADVDDLINKQFLVPVDEGLTKSSANTVSAPAALESVAATALVPATTTSATSEPDTQMLYRRAYPIATKLTASLGLRGFRLNLAVEAASGYSDLVDLLPQITQAVGPTAAQELKKALALG